MRYLISLLLLGAITSTGYTKCPPHACYMVDFDVQTCALRAVESVDAADGVVLGTGHVTAAITACSKGGELIEAARPLLIEQEREFFFRTNADETSCAHLLGKHLTLFAPDRCCDVGNCSGSPARELIDPTRIGVDEVITPAFVEPASSKQYPPKYPKNAAEQKISGKLLLDVLVSEQGKPLSIQIVQASPPGAAAIFGDAAKEALMQWTYRPGTKGGRPYSGHVLIPLDFSPR